MPTPNRRNEYSESNGTMVLSTENETTLLISNLSEKKKKCCCCNYNKEKNRWFYFKLVVITSILISSIGAFIYFLIQVHSGALKMQCNASLFIWQYRPKKEEPFILYGVFFYTFVYLLICTKLWCTHGRNYMWYALISFFCFVGQCVCQAFGDYDFYYAFLLSNCFEQFSLWSLIVLGKQIYDEIETSKKLNKKW